jgi:hypothetical protein
VVPGSTRAGVGGIEYKVVVLATLRGTIKPGITMDAASGGPCAHNLVEGAEYVLPLGRADTVGVGRVNGGVSKPLPTSLAVQLALARTKHDDVRAHARVVYRAALANKKDRPSLLSYLEERPDVVAALSAKQRRQLGKLLGKQL